TFKRWLAEDPAMAKEAQGRPVRIALDPGATGVSSLREGFRQPLLILMAGVGLLLLVVCLNVSHLLLARGMNRQREMSIRTALGGAGLLAGTLGKLRQVQTGFDEQHVLLLTLTTPVAGLSEPEAQILYDDLQRRVAGLPGVRAASLSMGAVLSEVHYSWSMHF